jgi:starch phosphorylase
MSSPTYVDRSVDTTISDALTDLALDLRWSYNHAADRLWEQLDPELWELTHNPWVVLQTVSREKLESVAADPNFEKLLTDLQQAKTRDEESDGWFQKAHPNSGVLTIAYLSMEFMLSQALPIYSGGLGNVAGDQLKATSRLCTHSTIPANCPSVQCGSRMVNGCGWCFLCPGFSCRFEPGRCR